MTAHRGPALGDLGAACALIECEALGDAHILHNRESGAIVASDAFGALLLDQLRKDPAPEALIQATAAALDVAPNDVRPAVLGTLEAWASDGLFLTKLRPFPGALPFRPATDKTPLLFASPHGQIRLACEDPNLSRDLIRALAPTGLATTATNAPEVTLDAIVEGPGYGLFRDGAPVWSLAPYDLTRFHILREIMDVVCGSERLGAHLHASAMARDAGALIFAGASGSGKSTLATLLLGAGCAQACDDHVAVDRAGTGIFAFPTRPNLKPGSQNLPSVQRIIETERAGPGDFVPRNRVPVATSLPIKGLILPHYDASGDNSLTDVPPDEALRLLIQTGSRVSRSAKSLAPLAEMLRAHPIRALHYRDNGFAIDACLALLDR